MKFGLAHRLLIDALAALPVLALLTTGRIAAPVALGLALAMVLAVSLAESWRRSLAERHVFGVAAGALVLAQAARTWLQPMAAVDGFLELLLALQILRVVTRRAAHHDHQIILLALVQLLAAIAVGGGLAFGLCLLALLPVAPAALVLSQLRREVEGNYAQGARDRTGLPVDVPRILRSQRVVGKPFIAALAFLSVPIALTTISFYALAPRLDSPWLDLPASPAAALPIGAPIDLTAPDRSHNPIALRATPASTAAPAPRVTLHLRATAFDHWDGHAWSQTTTARTELPAGDTIPITDLPDPDEPPAWHIELAPLTPPVLLVPRATKAVRLDAAARIHRAPEDGLLIQTRPRPITYDVFLGADPLPPAHLAPRDRERYLQLPRPHDDRRATLARAWTAGLHDPTEQAQAIEHHLRTEYRYTLSSPSTTAADAIDDFLFTTREGHCTFFSTAMALLLRELHTPSRPVTGFGAATWNRFGGYYAVRSDQSHAWVEAHIPNRGWQTFDPTPSATPTAPSILSDAADLYDATDRRWSSGLDEHRAPTAAVAKHALLALLVLLSVGALVWLLQRPRLARATDDPQPTSLYALLDRAMANAGVPRPRTTPPLAHAIALERAGHPSAAEIRALTERYLEARFGHAPFTSIDRADFITRARNLERT